MVKSTRTRSAGQIKAAGPAEMTREQLALAMLNIMQQGLDSTGETIDITPSEEPDA